MKKVLSILAIAVLSTSLFSCQPESTPQETDALYKNVGDVNADGDDLPIIVRDH